MRVLLLGATGMIGAAAAARMSAAGVQVVGVSRTGGQKPGQRIAWVRGDIANMPAPDDWRPHLVGIDAVVNCGGVLQNSPFDSTSQVHHTGVAALLRPASTPVSGASSICLQSEWIAPRPTTFREASSRVIAP